MYVFLCIHLYISSYNQVRIPLVTGFGLVMMKCTQESKGTFSPQMSVFLWLNRRVGNTDSVIVSAFLNSPNNESNIWANFFLISTIDSQILCWLLI